MFLIFTNKPQGRRLDKSELMFSCKVEARFKSSFTEWLPMKCSPKIAKYLGLPTHVGRSKKAVFSFLVDSIWKKLKCWKEKCLSFAGRGVLIKVVAQAIPTYAMSCFLPPDNLCDQLEMLICHF
ncbi:hypothetical protein A2U01_0044956 [Trifolium medium]|uniref:RNA-directed DNA polymerase (Reverse transcriptase) n=1 Tax=Trifolium medium TaxID=97028 RepID=A0A392QIQ2_9FABA|nr:hypothetical protein [Trifolium medium]